MKLHIRTPFALDKDLGRVYNEAMRDIPEGDWCCILDYDVSFLTHESIPDIYEYINRHPDAGILTCNTNRIGNDQQLYKAGSYVTDMRQQIKFAQNFRQHLYQVRSIDKPISGFLMCISKATWNDYKFQENGKCLGVDNKYSELLLREGKEVLLMKGVYVHHIYRMLNGSRHKEHLL